MHCSVSRREALRALALSPLLAAGCGEAVAERPPNIFLFLADDLAWHDIGCYGSPNARTPNIDRLAAEGMRFERAFTATAMCAPMRQQMYTGLYPVRNGAYPNHSQSKPGTQSIPHFLKPLGYRVGLVGKKHFGPPENYPFEECGEPNRVDFAAIQEFVARDAEQPFFLVVCSHEPHLPWTEGDASSFDQASFELAPYLVDLPETRAAYAKYMAEVEAVDGEVGQCLEILAESGQAPDTMFVFCSEQGVQFPHGKWTCYDVGLREGFVVRWPGRVAAGTSTPAMVEGVDFLPTILEAAGGDPGAHDFDGTSYLRVLEGETDEHAEYVFGVHTTRGIIQGSRAYPIRSIRDGKYKLILNLNHEAKFQNVLTEGGNSTYWDAWKAAAEDNAHAAEMVRRYQFRPAVEFYDVVVDPYEMTNLAEDPAHADRIAAMRERLEAWMAQQGDEGLETELAVKPHRTGVP